MTSVRHRCTARDMARYVSAILFAILSFVALSSVSVSAEEQSVRQAKRNFNITLAGWTLELERLENVIEERGIDDRQAATVNAALRQLNEAVLAARSEAAAEVTGLEEQLAALGPVPEDGAAPESPKITRTRQELGDAISVARSKLALADLTLTRMTEIETRFARQRRSALFSTILTIGSLPYDPDTISQAGSDLVDTLVAMVKTAPDWWNSLSEHQKTPTTFIAFTLMILACFTVAWLLRKILLARFGPVKEVTDPTYRRRLLAAVAEGMATGILPAAILLVILLRTQMQDAVIYSPFGDLIGLTAGYLILFILVTALPHAVLLPEYPYWRLTRIPPLQAQQILRHITAAAILLCVAGYFFDAAEKLSTAGVTMTPELRSVLTFGFNVALGAIFLSLLRPGLWRLQSARPDTMESIDEEERDPAASPDDDRQEQDDPAIAGGSDAGRKALWHGLRLILGGLAIVGMVAPALGYVSLGNYVTGNLLTTVIAVGILYILRGLFREIIGLATGSRFARIRLGLPYVTRNRIKFVARALLDMSMVMAGLLIIAPGWGVPAEDLSKWLTLAFGSITVGNFTFSAGEIGLALIGFVVVLGLTGATKRVLNEKVLPETQIDESLRHSITAGVGYIGFILALIVAVMAAGVDLTNIALIAGALSVGIGFGLQGIVNNFVSGVILLIERPIKVGDWVVVGPNEGFVKNINMRATEIETWQRASVIVPNADLLSNALTNWTHKDKIGRVDVPVSVALDSDPDKVEAILLEIGRAHPKTRAIPPPVAFMMSIEADRLMYELRIFTTDILWVIVIGSELRAEIVKRFRDEGIVIPYSQRVVHLVEGDQPGPMDLLKSETSEAPAART